MYFIKSLTPPFVLFENEIVSTFFDKEVDYIICKYINVNIDLYHILAMRANTLYVCAALCKWMSTNVCVCVDL